MLTYLFLIAIGIAMVYPLIWMFLASFKPNEEIFGSIRLLPQKVIWDSYIKGWITGGQYSFGLYLANSFKLVVPTVAFTIISSIAVAYGFARFKFPFHKLLFALMISTLMLPNAMVIIPRYLLFREFDWLNTYKTFTMPALMGCYPFFTFMFVQFFRGLPRELDESAKIDGCNSFTILIRILIPLCKPAIFSGAIFQFVWTWNDFFNSLVYINSVKKFPVSLGLRMSLDVADAAKWNEIFAMSIVAILPSVLLFAFAQKYFVEGVATAGLKE